MDGMKLIEKCLPWVRRIRLAAKAKRRYAQRREWFEAVVLFQEHRQTLPGFLSPLVKKGDFTHCSVLSPVKMEAFSGITHLDPQRSNLAVSLLVNPYGAAYPVHLQHIASDFKQRGLTAVYWCGYRSKAFNSHHWTNFFPGCTTLIKAHLGLSLPVWRPQSFYRWLLKHGGREIGEFEAEMNLLVMRAQYANIAKIEHQIQQEMLALKQGV